MFFLPSWPSDLWIKKHRPRALPTSRAQKVCRIWARWWRATWARSALKMLLTRTESGKTEEYLCWWFEDYFLNEKSTILGEFLGNQYQEYLIQGWSGSTQGAPQPDRLHLMELQREVRWAKNKGRYGSLWNDQRKFRSLYFRVTEFQSKEISQQRSHTAQKSHNKEVSHQRSLSQQRSLTASLARKLRFHIFSIQFMREVSHRFHNFNCHFLREVSHEGFVFTSSSFSQLQLSHFEGSLARELRFHIFNFHEVSHESFIFTAATFLARKLRFHNLNFQFRKVSHRFHNFNCHFLREVSHESFFFTSSTAPRNELTWKEMKAADASLRRAIKSWEELNWKELRHWGELKREEFR